MVLTPFIHSNYEVLPGNTQDKQTLRGMLEHIGKCYGVADRIWIMDRGIPTEEVLEEMRESEIPVCYLVGTPRGFLSRLHELREQKSIDRDRLLKKIGAAEKEAGRIAGLIDVTIPSINEPVNEDTFYWKINRNKYRNILMRDGRYLLRTNQTGIDPSDAWKQYMLLTEVEEAFRNLKGDLAIRPIYHQLESRIEAHIFVSFLAYCLHVTLRQLAKTYAPGLTPRSILEQMKVIQMIDVHIPTTDGRELKMSRYTKPDKAQQLLLTRLKFILPPQPPPKISSGLKASVVKTF
jgi:transposase